MIIITDSGSTKTLWSLIDQNGVKQIRTSGFNPFFNGIELAEKEINQQALIYENKQRVQSVFFYGAGYGDHQKRRTMQTMLQRAFPNASVSVDSDLLGAARGLFINQKGIACILGTGSNSGLYNGKSIVRTTPALGYILGDEGSGNHMGKELLKAYLRKDMPAELSKKFREKYPQSNDNILHDIYHQNFPSKYLAGFAPFIHEHKNHPYLQQLLQGIFTRFFLLIKNQFPGEVLNSLRMTGSVAGAFHDELHEAAEAQGMKITHIDPSPMEGLIQYHSLEK